MLYALNLYSDICQLFLRKNRKKIKTLKKKAEIIILASDKVEFMSKFLKSIMVGMVKMVISFLTHVFRRKLLNFQIFQVFSAYIDF